MSFHHPFGGWSEGGQGYSSANSPFSSGPSQPSIYGALPYVSDPAYPNMVTFFFTELNPGILNCTVVNAQAKPVFQIVTDNQMQGYTMIKNAEGRNVSLIEWQAHPMIEIRGHVSKQYVKNWLGLTSDKSSRTMSVRGMSYIWAPRDKSINLYAGGGRNPTLLARINRANGAITLDMTPDAMQLGLLDTAVSAVLLLQCGRNID
ncbi:hypothetical protein HYPSUDRAFT_134643 [Hypholoma sublateritium FD-334 SS-4]|uniref:DUF6593 domain-containing protein n=1 Tax=Hypholoma sublateritium (strain FD-334 SS-4) TaxID=945553 RepID=A0A0D2LDF5_HYPSF|nr:hypothetical protein HYPSUDRAFT_134643 [Hypholoma sublateritium FD-334 SS-4]